MGPHFAFPQQLPRRRDGRVAEGARLESVFTRKGNVGSNPTLSASLFPSSWSPKRGSFSRFSWRGGVVSTVPVWLARVCDSRRFVDRRHSFPHDQPSHDCHLAQCRASAKKRATAVVSK